MKEKTKHNTTRKGVKIIINLFYKLKERVNLAGQHGQSTMEYALVLVIAGIISAILVAVGKPMIIDIISKAFAKISSMV